MESSSLNDAMTETYGYFRDRSKRLARGLQFKRTDPRLFSFHICNSFKVFAIMSKTLSRTSKHRQTYLFSVERLKSRQVLSSSSISGVVFNDLDNNGQLTAAEVGIGEVSVLLQGVTEVGNSVTQSTKTDAFGGYSFENLEAGEYSVSAEQAAGFLDGDEQVGNGSGNALDDIIEAIVLGSDTPVDGYNFGELAPSTLKGSVYVDYYRDGNFDYGDEGLLDVDVSLNGRDDRGKRVKSKVQSSSDGSYAFTDLRPGIYTLTAKLPTVIQMGERR